MQKNRQADIVSKTLKPYSGYFKNCKSGRNESQKVMNINENKKPLVTFISRLTHARKVIFILILHNHALTYFLPLIYFNTVLI